MTCSIPDCDNLAERSGKCATHARLERKVKEQALKPKKKPARIAKVGTKSLFECSDGSKVTEAQIHRFLTEAYAKFKSEWSFPMRIICWGCGQKADGHAHIIAKARCRVIHKTELIWNQNNFFPACHACNMALENPKGQEWKKLKNIDKCLKFIEQN